MRSRWTLRRIIQMNADLSESSRSRELATGARRTTQKHSMSVLLFLAIVSASLMILPKASLHYGNLVIDAPGGLQLDFLLNPRHDSLGCESAINAVANTVIASCQNCRIVIQQCLRNPPAEVRQRFDEIPLSRPSARMVNGIVIYSSLKPEHALLACQESERQAALRSDRAKVICYASGAARPKTAFERQGVDAGYGLYALLLAAMGGFIGVLIFAILLTRHQHSTLSPEERAFASYPRLEKFTLAGVDTLILLGTFLAISWPASDDINQWSRFDRNIVIGHGIIVALAIGWFWLLLEHYARRRPYWDELREIVRVLLVMFMVAGATAFAAGIESGRANFLIGWALNIVLIPLTRATARQLLDGLGLWQRPAVIVGAGENARKAYLAIQSERSMGYRILGFVKIDARETPHTSLSIGTETFPVYDETWLRDLPAATQTVLSVDSLTDPKLDTLVQHLLAAHGDMHIIPSLRGMPLFGIRLSHFFSHEVLFLTVRNNLSRRSLQWIKRAFDIVVAGLLLLILAPLMVYVAWGIWREDGGPVIFRQLRISRKEGEFGFLKFRSMVKDADTILTGWRETDSPEWREYHANNFKLKNDPRVLRVGAWIRATSIDELPQLINVLRGEMSLVGPRPLLPRELPDYGNSINYYRQVRPGITGLWQISGRSETKFSDRAALDEWYVQNWSMWYDIAILFKTVDVVLNRRGAH